MSEFKADLEAIGRIEAVPTILDVVCRTTGMGFAAVARVTADRWMACSVHDDIAFGLRAGGELPVGSTICDEIQVSRQAVVIDNVDTDRTYSRHATPELYGFKSYISMPIILPDGRLFGTLCAIDPRPRPLNTPAVVGMFKLFADLIAFHIDTLHRLDSTAEALTRERRDSELREQFIAVLGHDLRNPLASIGAAGRALLRDPSPTDARGYVRLIQNSVGRMSGLIDNVMDFARGRLGGGLPLEREAAPLEPMLVQVVEELRAGHPGHAILTEFGPLGRLHCDRGRIGQLLSNLLANALTHGAPDSPVRVRAQVANGAFVLAVENAGEPIPPETRRELFQPFARAAAQRSQQGLGLGLYIAAEIARAHGGTLSVESDAAGTRFTFTMPARAG